MPSKTPDYDCIVIGAGFSGIRTLWELGQLNLTAKCFEAGSDVGGAWYWNRYPGARTDSEAWVYAMNFAPGLSEQWNYSERYPSQAEVQQYIGRVADQFDLRKQIQFNAHVQGASYSDSDNLWTVTTADGSSATCRFFLPATGPLSVAKKPPFAGLDTYTGEWYQASNWPKRKIDFRGKRVAIVGTGATGVQIVPKIAGVVKDMTVFQRTPNYVLPGRNYVIDEHQNEEIKENFDATWSVASNHPSGLAMKSSGRTAKEITVPEEIRSVLDAGWETGGFHFQFETFDDLFTDKDSNAIASEYLRQKIRSIVNDPETAELLCPKYPFLSKRPPCGHFYYEAYNRHNVHLVDISHDDIEFYEKGIRTLSGTEYEVDMVIFALGFDAATGALSEMDIRGSHDVSLREKWAEQLQTFAGVLVPEFPNMFVVCGPHIPFGNMPVVLDQEVSWIGKTLRHMVENQLATINVTADAAKAWSEQLEDAFSKTLFAESAKTSGAWFVGANIPGKAVAPLLYFGGVQEWASWLEKESKTGWDRMDFVPIDVVPAAGQVQADSHSMAKSAAPIDVASVA